MARFQMYLDMVKQVLVDDVDVSLATAEGKQKDDPPHDATKDSWGLLRLIPCISKSASSLI